MLAPQNVLETHLGQFAGIAVVVPPPTRVTRQNVHDKKTQKKIPKHIGVQKNAKKKNKQDFWSYNKLQEPWVKEQRTSQVIRPVQKVNQNNAAEEIDTSSESWSYRKPRLGGFHGSLYGQFVQDIGQKTSQELFQSGIGNTVQNSNGNNVQAENVSGRNSQYISAASFRGGPPYENTPATGVTTHQSQPFQTKTVVNSHSYQSTNAGQTLFPGSVAKSNPVNVQTPSWQNNRKTTFKINQPIQPSTPVGPNLTGLANGWVPSSPHSPLISSFLNPNSDSLPQYGQRVYRQTDSAAYTTEPTLIQGNVHTPKNPFLRKDFTTTSSPPPANLIKSPFHQDPPKTFTYTRAITKPVHNPYIVTTSKPSPNSNNVNGYIVPFDPYVGNQEPTIVQPPIITLQQHRQTNEQQWIRPLSNQIVEQSSGIDYSRASQKNNLNTMITNDGFSFNSIKQDPRKTSGKCVKANLLKPILKCVFFFVVPQSYDSLTSPKPPRKANVNVLNGQLVGQNNNQPKSFQQINKSKNKRRQHKHNKRRKRPHNRPFFQRHRNRLKTKRKP